ENAPTSTPPAPLKLIVAPAVNAGLGIAALGEYWTLGAAPEGVSVIVDAVPVIVTVPAENAGSRATPCASQGPSVPTEGPNSSGPKSATAPAPALPLLVPCETSISPTCGTGAASAGASPGASG